VSPVFFVTANEQKHREVAALLSGVDVRPVRLDLQKPPSGDLEEIARVRAADAFAKLGAPCFCESTGLYLYEHGMAPGASFKREWRALGEAGFARRYGGSRGVARVAVGVALAAGDVRVLSGSVAGALLSEPRPSERGYGYDRLWVPDGYDRTLAEMFDFTYVVNMRAAPYLELGDLLRGGPPLASFEVHLTVDPSTDPAALRAVCRELGLKCVVIELPRGESPHQPMTASFHRGAAADVVREAVALAKELASRGFDVIRTKIEQHGRLEGTPESDEVAARGPATSYFEYHIKIATPDGADLGPLAGALARVGGYLSWNSEKGPGKDGLVERFVTLRLPGLGRASAEARFEALARAVDASGVQVRNRVREYTVFDTNLGVDAGWMDR
jgi:inosine/xanthosine triphosphate pyrophosphatase family protein